MEPITEIPFCPIPTETISDMVPLLIVAGVFLMAGWFYRRRKKKRGPGKRD